MRRSRKDIQDAVKSNKLPMLKIVWTREVVIYICSKMKWNRFVKKESF